MLKFLTGKQLEKYFMLKCNNFIRMNPMYVWCPAPGCNAIAESSNLSVKEIMCGCGYTFCFICGEEAHRPISCSLVKEWSIKSTVERKNIAWILVNTKPCPNCKRPIEKNHGCRHMTCSRNVRGCGFEFCWLCKAKWSKHESSTGIYNCNKFERSRETKKEIKRKGLKTDLAKFAWYFERYQNHSTVPVLIKKNQLVNIEKEMEKPHYNKILFNEEVEGLKLAVDLIIKFRRALKWSFVYGYFLNSKAEKDFFEHLQEKLEKNTEHLNGLVENSLDEFLNTKNLDKSISYHFKGELTNYCQVTKNFFENLLDGIENGLTSQGIFQIL